MISPFHNTSIGPMSFHWGTPPLSYNTSTGLGSLLGGGGAPSRSESQVRTGGGGTSLSGQDGVSPWNITAGGMPLADFSCY